MASITELRREGQIFKNHDSCGFTVSEKGACYLEQEFNMFLRPGTIGIFLNELSDDKGTVFLLRFGKVILAVSPEQDLFFRYVEKDG